MAILIASHDVVFVTTFVTRCLCVNRSVTLHPTTTLDGGVIRELYGGEMALVRHTQALGAPDTGTGCGAPGVSDKHAGAKGSGYLDRSDG